MVDFPMFFNFFGVAALKKMNASEKDGAGEGDGEGKRGRIGVARSVGSDSSWHCMSSA